MLIDLHGKVAVVTGAARGIGKVIADRLASEGVSVCRWDRAWREPAPDRFTVDVTDDDSVRAAVDQTVASLGRVDILVNNAGLVMDSPVVDLAEETWLRVIDVNLNGVFRVSKAVALVMQQQHSGRIINASSFAAVVPSFGSSAYAASKAGVASFTRVLAGELGPWGITVNAYAPGMVPTEMNKFAERSPAEQAALLDTLTLRRWETADDVADLVCFLSSDRASYITGTLIDISGGKLATQRPREAYLWAEQKS
ncbi:MAG: SDR family NAD(P)-dependent oxidoreductase [Propionicimonas sp.]